MKIILIHGWHASPESNWYPWIKMKLETKGHEVLIPEMPNTHVPKIEEWIPFLENIIIDKNTILIGHSIGCQTILRYLERNDIKPKKVIMVAPWMNLTDEVMSDENESPIAKPWIETPLNFSEIKNKSEFVCIFSDDDPYVPLSDSDIFKEKLNAEIIIERGMSHFDEDTNCRELPTLLEFIR